MDYGGQKIIERTGALGEELLNADNAHERLDRICRYMNLRGLTSSRNTYRRLQASAIAGLGIVLISPLLLAAAAGFLDTSVYRRIGLVIIAGQLFVTLLFLIKRDWLRVGRRGILVRSLPALAWWVFVGLNPAYIRALANPDSGIGEWGPLALCCATFVFGGIWIAPIRPLDSTPGGENEQRGDAEWSGLDRAVLDFDRSLHGNEDGWINTRATVAFTILSALMLNLFSLVGALSHPLLYSTLVLVLVLLLSYVWRVALDQRRRAGLQLSGDLGPKLSFFLILVAGGITFSLGFLVEYFGGVSWIDCFKSSDGVIDIELEKAFAAGFNRRDGVLFVMQVVALIFATGVPIWASQMYANKTSMSLRGGTVFYSVRGKTIFEIDQATCVVRSCRGTRLLWPRTLWLPVTVVRPGGENILVHMKWKARGMRKNSRYVYSYSEIHHGDDLTLVGAPRGAYRMAKVFAFVSGRKLVPWTDSAVNVVEPMVSANAEAEFPYLSIHGVPPYIPSNFFSQTKE